MVRGSWRDGALAVVALMLLACGHAGGQSGPASSSRDSAGVTIVSDVGAAGGGADLWTLSSGPLLQIGVVQGDSVYELAGVKAARLLSDGTIVVANGVTRELRFYDQQGRFVRSAGRKGDGPGEFRTITELCRFGGDSLLVYDAWDRRTSVFAPDGKFVRVDLLPDLNTAPGPMPAVEGVSADGSIVIGSTTYARPYPNGYRRDTTRVVVLSRDRTARVEIGAFPAKEMSEKRSSSGTDVVEGPLPFLRRTWMAAERRHVWVGTDDTYELRAYRTDGTLERIVRRTDQPARPVTDALFDRFIQWTIGVRANIARRAGAKPNPAAVRKGIEDLPRVPALPTHGEMLVDGAGDLWVQAYVPPWDTSAPRSWAVYAPNGRLLGRMRTPAGLEVLDVGPDAVLGLATDSLDVQHVQLWGLARH